MHKLLYIDQASSKASLNTAEKKHVSQSANFSTSQVKIKVGSNGYSCRKK